jgi:hypothetical protein
MLDNSGDSLGFPDAEPGASGVDRGRLAGLLLRLHARRFTGLAYVSSQSRTTTLAFRDGIPVMVDSSAPESSLADDLVARGLLSRDEYAELIARVTEDLVENEDVAICEHAVSLGYLSEEQIKRELSERVRSKLIQSLALVDCEVELDDAHDALSGVAEYPQNVGAVVYMGVRTFYAEDVLRGYVPDLKRNYLRLSKTPAEIARFFELDFEEIALLNAIDPQAKAAEWFERSDLETSHAMQLIALLLIGGMCEFSVSAFVAPEAERSGVRNAATRPDTGRQARPLTPMREPRPGSRGAIPAVREEVYEPRSGSRAGMPAVQSRPDSGLAHDPRMEPNTTPATSRTDGSGAHNPPRRQIVESSTRSDGSGAHNAPRRPNDGSGAHAAFWRAPVADPSISRPRPASAPQDPTARSPAGKVPSQPLNPSPPMAADSGDAATEALAEARARAKERRGSGYTRVPREPNVADKRPLSAMDHEAAAITERAQSPARRPASRPQEPAVPPNSSSSATPAERDFTASYQGAANANAGSGPGARAFSGAQPTAAAVAALRNLNAPAPAPGSGPGQTAASPEYQKAHLKELMQRKQQAAGPGEALAAAASRRDPVRELRAASESLREGQYARAEEQLRALAELSPADDTIRAYHLWAQLRASQHLEAAQLASLRDLAKRMVAEPTHASFACYILAHLYLAEKKDDQAEKYFRKAHHLDKTNKDAERHIVILERRKQHAQEGDTGNQRKLFGITLGKPKE